MNGGGRIKMPYEIRREKNKHCVYNKNKNEKKGCHDDYESAVAHMRVLYSLDSGGKLTKQKK